MSNEVALCPKPEELRELLSAAKATRESIRDYQALLADTRKSSWKDRAGIELLVTCRLVSRSQHLCELIDAIGQTYRGWHDSDGLYLAVCKLEAAVQQIDASFSDENRLDVTKWPILRGAEVIGQAEESIEAALRAMPRTQVGYTKAELRAMTDLSDETIRKAMQAVGVPRLGKGKSKERYTPEQALRTVEYLASHSMREADRDQCRKAAARIRTENPILPK